MTDLVLLRTLIWDKLAVVWTDVELEYFLDDFDGDVYRTAAHMLRITMGDPNRVQSYRTGGVSKTYQEILATVKYYESMASTGGASSTSLKKVY